MTDRTPDEIEREIEAERGALARSLDALQNQFSPDAMVNNATEYLRRNGGEWAQSASRQARDNPVALAITGVGLAWLIAGPARKRSSPGTYDRWAFTHDQDAFRKEFGTPRDDETEVGHSGSSSSATTRSRPAMRPESSSTMRPQPMSTPGTGRSGQPRVGYDDRTYAPVSGFRGGGDPMTGSMRGFDDRVARASEGAQDEGFMDRMSDMGGSLLDRASRAFDGIRDRFGSSAPSWTRSSPDWTTGTGSTDEGESLRQRLMEGTEKMTDAARERVIAAREAALDAQHYMAARGRDYAATGREYYSDQPLVGGLLAFGIGALIGAALPRTRQEDAYIGAYRDRALEEAERIYNSESEKLKAVADAALTEAKSVASETLDQAKSKTPSGQEAVSRAEGAAKSAADRVVGAAKSEADKQNLGGSAT